MKILDKLFPRRPPEPLSEGDLQDCQKRSLFCKQLTKHYGKSKLGKTSWINYRKRWYLVCPKADSQILKRYSEYIRKALPKEDSDDSSPLPICYVKRDRTACCPACEQDYKNVSGPFPKNVRCRKCKKGLNLVLLDEK